MRKYNILIFLLMVFYSCQQEDYPQPPPNSYWIDELNSVELNYVYRENNEDWLKTIFHWRNAQWTPRFYRYIRDNIDSVNFSLVLIVEPSTADGEMEIFWDLQRTNANGVSVPVLRVHDYSLFVHLGQPPDYKQEYPIPIISSDYDTDGDYISDAVEDENWNVLISGIYRYDKNYNSDPPLITGTLSRHQLTHDFSIAKSTDLLIDGLRIANQSTGYVYYEGSDPSENDEDNWGTLTTINLLERVARIWYNSHPDYPITYMDISLEGGGVWDDHPNSHRRGVDVDIRYMANTPNLPINQAITIESTDPYYDKEKSLELLLLFNNMSNVSNIFTEDPYLYNNSQNDKITNEPPHRDHFHVRINPIFGLE